MMFRISITRLPGEVFGQEESGLVRDNRPAAVLVDIDVSTGKGEKHTKPEDVRAATTAAFAAGAHGVVLSREYHEMWLANLSAAGETTRQIFKGNQN